VLAVGAERRRAWAERQALRDEILKRANAWDALLAERDAARDEVHQIKMEFLNFRAAVIHDKQQLAEIARERMLFQAQIATRDPTLPLH